MPARKKSSETGSSDTAKSKLETQTVEIDPTKLRSLEENARFMSAAEFGQLVDNVKKDGCLTSYPLVAKAGNAPLCTGSKPDDLEVLSGNHRTAAAVEAGLEEISVIEILTPLSVSQKKAIQLAHNKIAGQDDPNILQKIYEEMDLEDRIYSGLSDDDFDVSEVDIAALSIGTPSYEDVNITFLPEDRQEFLDLLERLDKSKKNTSTLVAPLSDFNDFFDTVIRTKDVVGVHNAAVAIHLMAKFANERLDQIVEENTAAE